VERGLAYYSWQPLEGQVLAGVGLLEPLGPPQTVCGSRVANSRGEPGATAAPAPHGPGRESNHGCRVCGATAVDWPLCWPAGMAAGHSSAAAPHCGGPDQRMSDSACTCAFS